MRNWLGVGVALGTLAALSAACSSTPVPPFGTVQLFCQAKAQAECVVATNCLIPTDQCELARTNLCETQASAAVAPPSTRQYYQPNAQACIDKVKAAYGAGNKVSYSDLFGPGSIDDLCNRVFQGKATNNTACHSDYDCTSSEICALEAPGSSMSVCATPEPKAAGAFCADPGSECATGTYCENVTGGAPLCNPRPGLNGVCNASTPCLESLRCLSGLCVPREQIGGACNPTGPDPNSDCDPTAPYCDPNASNRCTPGLSFASESADCNAYSLGAADAGAPPVDSGASDTGSMVSEAGTEAGD
jgi:hypothetical protein